MRISSHHAAARQREPGPQAVALVLDEHGIIRSCRLDGARLFGYTQSELAQQPISKLLPQLAGMPLVHDGRFNSRLDFLCHCGHLFAARDKQGAPRHCELHFVHLSYQDENTIRLILRPAAPAPIAGSSRSWAWPAAARIG